jgi:hypothetical protein
VQRRHRPLRTALAQPAQAEFNHEWTRIYTNEFIGVVSPWKVSSKCFVCCSLLVSISVIFVVNPTSDLIIALRERLAIIQDQESRRDPEKHTARLRAVSDKIDNLASALPKPIDPQFAHFLQRKSYDKALEFLEARAD